MISGKGCFFQLNPGTVRLVLCGQCDNNLSQPVPISAEQENTVVHVLTTGILKNH